MKQRVLKMANGKAPSSKHGPKLLLVDENTQDLNYYTGALRHLGYEVFPVDSYSHADAALKQYQFDLVIVDQGGRGFEGRAVLTRAVEVDRHVPVLVLTRVVDAECCLEALDSGAYEYVQKPLTVAEVRELVNDYLKPEMETGSIGHVRPIRPRLPEEGNEGVEPEAWRRAS